MHSWGFMASHTERGPSRPPQPPRCKRLKKGDINQKAAGELKAAIRARCAAERAQRVQIMKR